MERLIIHNRIENRIYIAIASSYKDEDNNSCLYWYKKAYRNAVTEKYHIHTVFGMENSLIDTNKFGDN